MENRKSQRLFKLSYIWMFCFLLACQNEQTNTKNISNEHNHIHHEKTLKLNQGNKWRVDEQMIIYLRAMENDLKLFQEKEDTRFDTITSKLNQNLELLTSNCTMTGKAHDELHKWLLPFIENVKQLGELKESKMDASKKVKELNESFKEFNQYFQ